MIIYVGTKSKKTKKQREKDRAAWNAQQEKYQLKSITKKGKVYTGLIGMTPMETYRRETPNYPSRDTGGGTATKKEVLTYTGDNLIGIGMMHKSNLVPVFKSDEAKDLSSMRR